jgi:hypothetical protein
VGNLDTSGFAATTGFDLGLNNNGAADFGSCCSGLLGGIGY